MCARYCCFTAVCAVPTSSSTAGTQRFLGSSFVSWDGSQRTWLHGRKRLLRCCVAHPTLLQSVCGVNGGRVSAGAQGRAGLAGVGTAYARRAVRAAQPAHAACTPVLLTLDPVVELGQHQRQLFSKVGGVRYLAVAAAAVSALHGGGAQGQGQRGSKTAEARAWARRGAQCLPAARTWRAARRASKARSLMICACSTPSCTPSCTPLGPARYAPTRTTTV